MSESEQQSGEIVQITLEGETLEFERIPCEMYPGVCSDPAVYEVDTLVYDGVGQAAAKLPACTACAYELTEPTDPDGSDKARRLRRLERWQHVG